MRAAFLLALACAIATACDFRHCPPVDETALAALPTRLSGTGLYADIATGTVADDVLAFTPRFPLWTDGAEKRRWLALPAGATIDAADPDEWRFPEGTRAWKEFVRDGVRVETRYLEKVGPGDADWAAVAYVWDDADATALPEGEPDARATAHDVPAADDCAACHAGRASFLLGVSAVQLDDTDALGALLADGRIAPAPGAVSQPEADAAALGYLHANCAHCHNADRDDVGCYDPGNGFDFTLPAAVLADAHDAPALQTAAIRLAPGNPDGSEVLHRMGKRTRSVFPDAMPPLGTEEVDAEGIATLRAWIEGL